MKKKLLLADSSATMAKIIKLALSNYQQPELEAVATLEQLQEKLRSEACAALIIDAGFAQTDEAEKLWPLLGNTPVLALLGSFQPLASSLAQLAQKNKVCLLNKPFSPQELVTALQQLGLLLNEQSEAKTPPRIPPQGKESKTVLSSDSMAELGINKDEWLSKILPLLKEELAELVQVYVQEYCEKHFKTLAREILTGELHKLADERARLSME
jgi:CheY-like chemotaxis protein